MIVEVVVGDRRQRVRTVVVLPAVRVGGADPGVGSVVAEPAVHLLAEVAKLGGAGDGVDAGMGPEHRRRGAADRVGLPAGRDAEAARDRRRDVDLRVDDGDPLVPVEGSRKNVRRDSTSVGSSARAGVARAASAAIRRRGRLSCNRTLRPTFRSRRRRPRGSRGCAARRPAPAGRRRAS